MLIILQTLRDVVALVRIIDFLIIIKINIFVPLDESTE